MSQDGSTASVAEDLQEMILHNDDVDRFLDELAVYSTRILGGHIEVHCGVTLKREKHAVTVANSGPIAHKLDEIQYGFDKGPCLAAIDTGTTTIVHDARTDDRWPDYFSAVAGHGFYSMMGVPLLLESGGGAGAALNFYARQPGTFTGETARTAEGYAAQASRALQLALRVSTIADTASHLKAALESRTTIDLAVGIVMGQNRCSQEEAFNILKAASTSRNVKLRDIAAGIVANLGGASANTHFED